MAMSSVARTPRPYAISYMKLYYRIDFLTVLLCELARLLVRFVNKGAFGLI